MRSNIPVRGILMAAVVAVGVVSLGQVAPPPAPTSRPSQLGVTSATLEGTSPNTKGAVIYYSRPNVTLDGNKRVIWGTLVPWGTVWRLGANEPTLLVTPLALDIGGLTVPAGTYSLYMLPVQNGDSKLIINKSVGHLASEYDDKQDLGRVTMKKETLNAQVETLIVALQPTTPVGGATLRVAWEGLQFSVEIKKK